VVRALPQQLQAPAYFVRAVVVEVHSKKRLALEVLAVAVLVENIHRELLQLLEA
jgi:hypothetical protein